MLTNEPLKSCIGNGIGCRLDRVTMVLQNSYQIKTWTMVALFTSLPANDISPKTTPYPDSRTQNMSGYLLYISSAEPTN